MSLAWNDEDGVLYIGGEARRVAVAIAVAVAVPTRALVNGVGQLRWSMAGKDLLVCNLRRRSISGRKIQIRRPKKHILYDNGKRDAYCSTSLWLPGLQLRHTKEDRTCKACKA